VPPDAVPEAAADHSVDPITVFSPDLIIDIPHLVSA
jgi:hypothetical protein